MPQLPGWTNDLDTLPDGAKGFYVEVTDKDQAEKLGKYKLDSDAVQDVTGLKTALGKEKTALKDAKQKLGAFGDITPDQAKEAIAALDGLEIDGDDDEGGKKKPVDIDKLIESRFGGQKKALTDTHQKELKARDEREGTLKDQIRRLMVDQAGIAAINEHGGNAAILMPLVKARTKVEEDSDGKFQAVVMDDNGEPLMGSDGGYMPIKDFVGGLKSDDNYASAFKGSGQSGSGSAGNGGRPGGGGQGNVKTRADLKTPADKAAYIKEHGHQNYLALPEGSQAKPNEGGGMNTGLQPTG